MLDLTQDQIPFVVPLVFGAASFLAAQCEWYWETFFVGHWKQWNTPSGRLYAKAVSLGCVGLGIAGLMGMFPGR